MPVLQNLVLADRATTPVNHTFTPYDRNGQMVVVSEYTGSDIGNRRFVVEWRKSSGKSHRKGTLFNPVVVNETINGVVVQKLSRRAIAKWEFIFDDLSTEQERKDTVGMLMASLDSTKALLNDFLVKGEAIT